MSFAIIDHSPEKLPKKATLMSRGQTALSKGLNEQQEAWLLDYSVNQFNALYFALGQWRGNLQRFERLMDDNYSDRAGAPNPEKTDARRSIFERQNDTLGVVSGKNDQVVAQAIDDIFGTRPWLAATPQGGNNVELADLITKHSQWKFNEANIEEVSSDAIRYAAHLGTAFPKLRWRNVVEEFETAEYALHSKKTKQPILNEAGDYILTDEEAEAIVAAGAKPADLEWKEILITEAVEVRNNVEAALLDWKDVAFDPMAPELDLLHTDFFHRFRMGVYDLVSTYNLTDEQRDDLLAHAQLGGEDEPREHRGESQAQFGSSMSLDPEANPAVWLVEGYVRCDPFNTGKPIRVHVVFSQDFHILFACDYLANVTPDGMLPVFAVRCFKVPKRIIGKGYWERFENEGDAIDKLHNGTILRNRQNADIFRGIDEEKLAEKLDGKDLLNSPDEVIKLKTDQKLADALQFVVSPDNNNRSDNLLQQNLQLLNVRMGTSSASQGDMTGIPENDTATGSKINAGRAALLDKTQIGQMMKDLRPFIEFGVHLIYANQDQEEAFTWGDGRDAEFLKITPGDVKGLKAKVTLTLTQSENLQRLESAKQAIEAMTSYSAVPEPDKVTQRRLYVQILSSLGFQDADKIARAPVFDPAGIMAIIPPETQPAFKAFLESQGMLKNEAVPAGNPVGSAPLDSPANTA